MTKEIIYKYLGTNGVIESPVYLEGIYSVRINILMADEGFMLTDGERLERIVRCSDEEVSKWKEIKG